MRKILALFSALGLTALALAQQNHGVTQAGQPTGQPPFPIAGYQELPNPRKADRGLWRNRPEISLGWGDTNTRYTQETPADVSKSKTIHLTAWRGERVSAQLVVSNNGVEKQLSYSISELTKDNSQSIGIEPTHAGFVRYVMTDELNKDGRGACGNREFADFDSSLVADVIDHHALSLTLKPQTTQGLWIGIDVPQNATPGLYKGNISIKIDEKTVGTLRMNLQVENRVLPPVKEWAFHLDLWQNPYAVARYYRVEPWSEAHFNALRTEMQRYVDAGGKVITASITHKPWNGQTHDYFETMVTWIKRADGTWLFDYTIFDKWVEFMMSIGIDKQINCYSMIPWRLSFQYYDQATNSLQFAETKPGEKEYDEMWTAMLKSFAEHLKEKGWMKITHISMDERPMETMLKTLEVIRKADPEFKVSLAGALHEELIDELDDYCVALRMKYTDEMLSKRKADGKITTFYTSCEETSPNTFTFSPPAECEWFGWYAAKAGLDGYLRWALNSWVPEPLLDSRFIRWAAGDAYLTYPGNRSSMRFERMREGIQAYEKIRILREEFIRKNDQAALQKIENALSVFDERTLKTIPASEAVSKARKMINGL